MNDGIDTLKDLRAITWHDSSPVSLAFDFDKNRITIALQEEVDAPIITVVFTDISGLELEALNDYDDLEIYTANFSKQEDHYTASFLFLLGSGKPSWEMRFSFRSATVTKV